MEGDLLWRRIDQRAPKVWRLTHGLVSLILWLVVAGAFTLHITVGLSQLVVWMMGACVLLYSIIVVLIMPTRQWLRWSYYIVEDEIHLRHGVWFVKQTVIPMVRIQHVDTKQGPFLRRYGLSSVTFSTAAGSHEIPALSVEVADEVRNMIVRLAKVSNEDV